MLPATTLVRHVLLTLAIAVLLASCGGGGPAVTPTSDFIPDFTFTWQNTSDSTHRYFLLTESTNVQSGQFSAGSNENYQGNVNPLTGTFNAENLTMQVTRPSGVVTITGRFLDKDTIRLTWDSTTVTVARCGQTGKPCAE